MRQHLWIFALAASAACGASPATRPALAAAVPPFPTGSFEDDYGGRHTVSALEWFQGTKARYRIVRWHPTGRYLIARNDSTNPTAPGGWTRIDWIALDGMLPYTWAFCFSAYDAPSAEAAEAVAVARPETPRTGCNGFPYSRLKPAAAPERSR